MPVAVILVAVDDPSVRAALADDLGHRFTPDYDVLEGSSSWARDQLDAFADAGRNVALVLAATACGQKGPLYPRDNPPPGVKPAKPPAPKPIPYPDAEPAEKN